MTGRLVSIAWKTKPRTPMIEASQSVVSVEAGVEGDFRGAPGKRQITILFADDWARVCAALGEARPWLIRRANLLIEGLANPRAAGGLLRVGPALLSIAGECDPCSNMDRQWPGLTEALTPDWLGGLTARVIEGGRLSVGDEARFEG